MRITLAAIGRMKAGPEHDLVDRYLARARATGRPLGLNAFDIREQSPSTARNATARRREESAKLFETAANVPVIALDEQGKDLTSRQFAQLLRRNLDDGTPGLCFAIGGADGHDPGLIERAVLRLRFGHATWPHEMVRAMLCEQLYRACTILAGHPYHRDGAA